MGQFVMLQVFLSSDGGVYLTDQSIDTLCYKNAEKKSIAPMLPNVMILKGRGFIKVKVKVIFFTVKTI